MFPGEKKLKKGVKSDKSKRKKNVSECDEDSLVATDFTDDSGSRLGARESQENGIINDSQEREDMKACRCVKIKTLEFSVYRIYLETSQQKTPQFFWSSEYSSCRPS